MSGVSIRIDGADAVGQRLGAVARALAQPRALWEEVGRIGVLQTQERFELERAPDGSAWPPSIRVLVEGGKTLTDSGRMKASITYEATDAGTAIGTNAIQAAIHQFGGRITAKTERGLMFKVAGNWARKHFVDMPRRAFLGLSPDNEAELLEAADEYMAVPLGEARQ
jgi:phage virion morphogenesis protein